MSEGKPFMCVHVCVCVTKDEFCKNEIDYESTLFI